MTPVIEFLKSELATDFSVALLHTLWQGLAITGILYLWTTFTATVRSPSVARYTVPIPPEPNSDSMR